MRIAVILFSVLLAQTSASFFSDLQKSMSSVGSSVGKLFSDASVDLKGTFHCTVFAVRQAFSSNDPFHHHFQKCQDNKVVSIPLSPSRPVVIYITPDAQTPKYVPKTSEPTTTEQNYLSSSPNINTEESYSSSLPKITTEESYSSSLPKITTEESYLSSMPKINTEESYLSSSPKISTEESHLSSIPEINNNNTKDYDRIEKKIESVEKYLLNETHNLANLSFKLEQQFEDLSKHVNEDFIKIKNEQKKSSIEKVMQQIDKLREEEQIHENNTDTEIREVFDELLNKVDKNKTDIIDVKKEIKLALAELEQNRNVSTSVVEQELEKWKKEELNNLNDIKELLKINNVKPSETTTIAPVVLSSKKPKRSRKRTTKKPFNDYDSLLNKDPKVLDQALKLVDNSKRTSAIMAALMKKEKSADSVFDRPDLLGR